MREFRIIPGFPYRFISSFIILFFKFTKSKKKCCNAWSRATARRRSAASRGRETDRPPLPLHPGPNLVRLDGAGDIDSSHPVRASKGRPRTQTQYRGQWKYGSIISFQQYPYSTGRKPWTLPAELLLAFSADKKKKRMSCDCEAVYWSIRLNLRTIGHGKTEGGKDWPDVKAITTEVLPPRGSSCAEEKEKKSNIINNCTISFIFLYYRIYPRPEPD